MIKLRDFESQILYFNGMYKLPVAAAPTAGVVAEAFSHPDGTIPSIIHRLEGFKATILDEISEVDEIITKLKVAQTGSDSNTPYTEMDFLVELADWLGDIQVYCASEMAKFGIPLKETLAIIMSSNFSKMQADGTVQYDANGKVLKGPAYWKPEPNIRAMLEERVADAASSAVMRKGILWEGDNDV